MPKPPATRPLLVISRNLPPVVGGMERLMHRLVGEISTETDCIVIGPRGCRRLLPQALKVYELPHAPAVMFVALAAVLTAWMVIFRPPRAILCGNGLMSLAACPGTFRCLRRVVLVHGLDIVANSSMYQRLCLPLIRASNMVIANSQNTARLARERGVPPARLAVVTPGVDMPGDPPDPTTIAAIDDGRPTLISVGRLVRRKGIAEFIRHSLPIIVAECPQVRLVVIGAEPTAALNRGESERVRIAAALRDTGLDAHVELVGFVDNFALTAWMNIARVHVFPVIDLPDDVEGFGLVALEAAAHGIPTVGFDAGGVRDAVDETRSGTLVKPGDYAALAQAICRELTDSARARTQRVQCIEFARGNGWPRYAASVRILIDHDAPMSRNPLARGGTRS